MIGARAIWGQLKQLGVSPLPSAATIQRILAEHGLTHHYSYAVWLNPHLDKRSITASCHLRQTWAKLGLPFIHQFDNEGLFCGGYRHPRIFGQVVRLCLFCGIEPLFTPYYDPQRNYQVESFHSVWLAGFWTRHEFSHYAEVVAETPTFRHW